MRSSSASWALAVDSTRSWPWLGNRVRTASVASRKPGGIFSCWSPARDPPFSEAPWECFHAALSRIGTPEERPPVGRPRRCASGFRKRSMALSMTLASHFRWRARCRDLENPVQIEIEPNQDLVAGRYFGKPLDQELADQAVIATVAVLPLKYANFGGILFVERGRVDFRANRRAAACSGDDRREAVRRT